MTDRESRERLIELILNAPRTDVVYGDIKLDKPIQTAQTVADHLLANGMIVPPCKVGDIVYTIFEGDIEALKITYTKTEETEKFGYRFYDAKNKFLSMPFSDRSIGKTVFLTREGAEKALAERGKK